MPACSRRHAESDVGIVIRGNEHGVDGVVVQHPVWVRRGVGPAELVEKRGSGIHANVSKAVQTNAVQCHRVAHVAPRHIAAPNHTQRNHGLTALL